MKIVIFENQYHQVKAQFEIANEVFFDGALEFTQYNSSQEFSPISRITEFDLAIIDISLSSNSDKDGYDLIESIVELPSFPKILIMTGNSQIVETLAKKQLPIFPILSKPIDAFDIQDKLKKIKI